MRFSTLAYRNDILRAIGALPLLLGAPGCSDELADAPSALAADEVAPPLSLTLPAHLSAGQTVQVVVNGATPGAMVYLAGSPTTGRGPCPPVLGGQCFDLVSPRQLGAARAAPNGRATFDVLLPHDLAEGLTVYLQAAQGGAQPAKTAAVPDVVEYPPRVCTDVPWLTPANYSTEFEVYACAPMPAGGVCPDPTLLTWQQTDWMWRDNTGGVAMGLYSLSPFCLETTVEDACCYDSNIFQAVIGRPFEVAGQARLAEVANDSGWCSDVEVDCDELSPEVVEKLAVAWTQTARGEHASVAAFARFVLHLSHLGAPADLVAEATRAMADEIRHARDAFAIASAFAGEAVGAGPLDATGSLGSLDARDLLRAAVREGCIGETIAAAQATVARDGCTNAAIRAVLDGVAADEQRHATLAWRFARWMVGRDASLRSVVAEELARGLQLADAQVDAHAAALHAYGVLADDRMNAVARRVFDDVVLPCAAALLGADEAFATA